MVYKLLPQDASSISQYWYEFKLSSLPFEISNNLWRPSELCHTYVINPNEISNTPWSIYDHAKTKYEGIWHIYTLFMGTIFIDLMTMWSGPNSLYCYLIVDFSRKNFVSLEPLSWSVGSKYKIQTEKYLTVLNNENAA